jgi:hypothetical protein
MGWNSEQSVEALNRGTGRGNGLDSAGWDVVADSLVGITSITSINGVDGCGPLFEGQQTEINLTGKRLRENEAIAVVARMLLRSAGTLEKLDLRCSSRFTRPLLRPLR